MHVNRLLSFRPILTSDKALSKVEERESGTQLFHREQLFFLNYKGLKRSDVSVVKTTSSL